MPSNFHVAYNIGNIGVIGFSGAGAWEMQEYMFQQACDRMSSKRIDVLFIVGHWDIPVFDIPNGLEPGMSIEGIHLRLRQKVPSCAKIPARKYKYVYGHTHCNRMILENESYLVAGQGMNGCGNYGFPVFDTTNDQFKVYHFLIEDIWKGIDNYDEIYSCIEARGISSCYHLAEEWTVVNFDNE